MNGALSNIKIIELSQVLAGPFCGYQFALLGAEVVKVELPDMPDCTRGRGPISELNDRGIGLTYQVQGGNKKSLALDVRTAKGRSALLKLVESADVFLENYSTGVLQALGLGYEELKAQNSRIVYCSMTGYGDRGPLATKGAFDNTIQAVSGIIEQCKGVKPGVSFVDYAAGYSAAFAISAALLQRERTGEGCYISASMLEVAMSLMAPEAAAKQVAASVDKVKESGISPYNTANGRLMLGAFKPSQYRKLGACLAEIGHNIPVLERIWTWEDVWSYSGAIRTALQDVFVHRNASEWQTILEACDIPAERIVTLDEAVAMPQLAQRAYFTPSPTDTSVTLPLASYRMSTGGPKLSTAPPVHGQNSRETLAAGGVSDAEIEALFAAGIVK